jgi:hypothetical protein
MHTSDIATAYATSIAPVQKQRCDAPWSAIVYYRYLIVTEEQQTRSSTNMGAQQLTLSLIWVVSYSNDTDLLFEQRVYKRPIQYIEIVELGQVGADEQESKQAPLRLLSCESCTIRYFMRYPEHGQVVMGFTTKQYEQLEYHYTQDVAGGEVKMMGVTGFKSNLSSCTNEPHA